MTFYTKIIYKYIQSKRIVSQKIEIEKELLLNISFSISIFCDTILFDWIYLYIIFV